jgi:hypothetical protein
MDNNISDTLKSPLTLDKSGKHRPDLLFSYWVLLWFFIYYFSEKNTPFGQIIHKWFNPTFALCFALSENVVTFFYILFVNPAPEIIVNYLIMMCVLKIFPLYLLRNVLVIRWPTDITIFLGTFFVYIGYLYSNNMTVMNVYRRTITSITMGQNDTPLFAFLHQFQGRGSQ